MTADGKLTTGRERLVTADGVAFCVRFGFLKKRILSFFDFWTIFCFFFLFILH